MYDNIRLLKSIGCESLAIVGDKLALTGQGIFLPTATTAYLLRASLKLISNEEKILDLGCGSGVIGLEIATRYADHRRIYMSDLSQQACAASQSNAEILKLKNVTVKNGSMFEPWDNEKFDVIISDVSGVSTSAPVSKIWFDGIPQDSGQDGLKLTSEVLVSARRYLRNQNSFVLLPLISLANQKIFWRTLENAGWSHETVSEHKWKLVIKSIQEKEKMLELKKEGNIQFEIEDEYYTCFTKILKISPPIETE